ncbi:MAG: aminotransferase class I/II-fold pyridoxal phosphate-dependent enzyme [Actinomycetota bacterium]
MTDFSAETLGRHVDDPTARGIARSIAGLVNQGVLRPGDRLPTVRSLATTLGIGRSAVADAWKILSDHAFIETARRNGTVVRDRRRAGRSRYWSVPADSGMLRVDLSTGTPDADLLPPIGPALGRLTDRIEVTSYIDPPTLPELEGHLIERWPYAPGAVTIVDGALDALDRLVTALVSFGDPVVVEDPTFPPLVDMLELAGAEIIPVSVDRRGVVPAEFAAALGRRPVACFIQPFAQNPTGASIDPSRLTELGALLRALDDPPWIVEDDHTGAALGAIGTSLAAIVPDRGVTVVSFSKTHGPDLRLAAVGGSAEIVGRLIERRRLGPTWTSRLLQHLLLGMLLDAETNELVEHARTIYHARRQAFADGLAAAGRRVELGNGLNMWVPVDDDLRATWALAVEQIGVAPGRPFMIRRSDQSFLRISVGGVRSGIPDLAQSIAAAAFA